MCAPSCRPSYYASTASIHVTTRQTFLNALCIQNDRWIMNLEITRQSLRNGNSLNIQCIDAVESLTQQTHHTVLFKTIAS